MDVDGILRRRPQACVVDELAHSNATGSPRAKRWEDVQVLLDSGIDVLTTMNVQDLASLTDQVWQITGLRVRETVPDWVFQQADEVVMVDVTPRALLHRLERGVIYPPERAKGEAEQVFQEPRLVALRELAIRQTAQALEARGPDESRQTEARRERILVHLTAEPSTAMLLRRARRVADYLHAGCVAVCVHSQRDFSAVARGRAAGHRAAPALRREPAHRDQRDSGPQSRAHAGGIRPGKRSHADLPLPKTRTRRGDGSPGSISPTRWCSRRRIWK